MSKAWQRVVDDLKRMRETGAPVWTSLRGCRVKIRPVEDTDWSGTYLYKFRGRLWVGEVIDKDGLKAFIVSPHYSRGVYLRWNQLLAWVVESHPLNKETRT
tara:strand:+ start:1327 stop:1629 length:303 start_codon:yes stop_codon:yes gene_type:complete